MITQKLLLELFEYKDGFLYWKTKVNYNTKIGTVAGCLNGKKSKTQRMVIGLYKKSYLASRLIFLYHHGYLPECVDHKDRDQLNDRIENLRPATKGQNNANRKSANKTSKFLGVCYTAQRIKNGDKVYEYYKWRAQIVLNKKVINLGSFDTEEEAAIAYNNAAKEIHKEYANINNI